MKQKCRPISSRQFFIKEKKSNETPHQRFTCDTDKEEGAVAVTRGNQSVGLAFSLFLKEIKIKIIRRGFALSIVTIMWGRMELGGPSPLPTK